MIRSCISKLTYSKHLLLQQHIKNTTQLFNLNITRLHSNPSHNFDEPFEIIADYVDPNIRTNNSKPMLIKQISEEFNCSKDKAAQIIYQQKNFKPYTFKKVSSIAAFLKSKDVPVSSIIENPWLFASNLRKYYNFRTTVRRPNFFIIPGTLQLKFAYIEMLHPRKINDLLPLLKISSVKLNKIEKTARREFSFIPGGNRIYFLADKLNVDPYIISKVISVRNFMLDIAYDNLVENLNIFLEYRVKPENILRDLWAFRYAPNSIRVRLERVKKAEKDKIMPWMVRCTEPVLAKTLQHAIDCKALLGENDSVLEYLSKRLGYNIETTRFIAMKHPAVLKVRVTKVIVSLI